jgi:2Fe-2S ferredoxin
MGTVTYVEFSGKEHQIEVPVGQSVMEGAVGNLVPGIVADCGGACACATCHVYVDPAWRERAGALGENEDAMLEVVMDRREGSRLSCQLRMSEALDGLVVRLPESQA